LTIHPFREGNTRTIKPLTDLLAAQTGRPLLAYDNSSRGANAYVAAAKKAFKRDRTALTTLIAEALERSR
jgi:fido (protein-threonine AMPylation protein)